MSVPRRRNEVKNRLQNKERPKSQIYLAFEALTCSTRTASISVGSPGSKRKDKRELEKEEKRWKDWKEKTDGVKGIKKEKIINRSMSYSPNQSTRPFYPTLPLAGFNRSNSIHQRDGPCFKNRKSLREEVTMREEERTRRMMGEDEEEKEAPRTSVGRLKQKFEMLAFKLSSPKKIKTRCASEPNLALKRGSVKSLLSLGSVSEGVPLIGHPISGVWSPKGSPKSSPLASPIGSPLTGARKEFKPR